MGSSSSPTVKDQLTGGQEMADQLLFRLISGLPMPNTNQDWAQALGTPRGQPFPLIRQGGNPLPVGPNPGQMGGGSQPNFFQPMGVNSGVTGPGAGLMQGMAGPQQMGQPARTPMQQPPQMGPQPPGNPYAFQPGTPAQYQAMTQQGSFQMPGATPLQTPVNAQINPTLGNAMNYSQILNPTQGLPEAWAALQPSMQGQQSTQVTPLSNMNPLPNLQLRQQQAGPNINLPTYNAPSPLNMGQVSAAPRLDLPNLQALNPMQWQNVAAAPKVGSQQVNLDLGYRYNPFQAQQASNNLGQAKDNYNFKPGEVRSTLDNAGNTQRYFQEGVMNPLLRQYDTAIAPRLNDAMAAAGNTFSTRAQTSRQMALQDLQTNALGELSRVTREDELTRAAQNLQAQQFNVGTSTQNAQFGGQLQQGYDLANMQRQLQIAGMNQQEREFGHTANTEGAFNQANFLNQMRLSQAGANNAANFQAAGINNQAQQFAQNLNAQGQLNAYNANLSNQLGFGQLNTQRATQAAGINNQAQQFAQSLNSQNALSQYGLNSNNAFNFAGLNSNNALQAGQLNNQNRQFYSGLDQAGQLGQFAANSQNQLAMNQLNNQRQMFNTQTQTGLAESAANRQLQSAGQSADLLNSQWNRTLQQLGMGSQVQQMSQDQQNRALQEMMRQMPENNPWMQMLMQYRGMPTNQNIFAQPNQITQGLNYASGGIGAGIGLLSLLGMI